MNEKPTTERGPPGDEKNAPVPEALPDRKEAPTVPEFSCPSFGNSPRGTDPTLTDDTPGPVPTIPGYEILGELGRGGMGVVYKARQVGLNRPVALKMVLSGIFASAADLARFRTEAEAGARLQHPNIVQVHAIGTCEGKPYFSLEFCGGGSLAQKVRGTPLPPREAAAMVETLARATAAAHQKEIIHRDLKPANVLLLEDGTPKITDFGLAKKLNDVGQTQTGAIMGTPSYMAPEQAAGKTRELGPAADIYSLGAILYELLTGRPPFKAATPMDTMMQVISDEPVAPRQLQSNTPLDLETICLKCLNKDPRKRYGTAADLAEDLRRFQAGEPILARPVSRPERVWRWCKRNRKTAILTASIVLLLLLLTVGSSVAALLLQEERDRVVEHKDSLEKTNAQLREAREEEKRAREVAVEKLWDSYLAQARAGRWSGRMGRRFDSLNALKKAAEIRPSLELRNEAIACLALVDVRVGKEWDGYSPGTVYLSFDSQFRRYARGDGKGNLSVRLVADDSEMIRLPGPGSQPWLILFDPTGRYLVGKYHPPGADSSNRVILWDCQQGRKVLEIVQSLGSFAFHPDGQQLAVGYPDHSVRLFDVSSGTETGKHLMVGAAPHALSYHPSQPRLAVSSRSGGVRVLDTTTGKVLKTLSPEKVVYGIAWHPHGSLLAAGGSDARVYQWNAETGAVHAVLEGHQHVVTNVSFNNAGDLLASFGWDGTLWLWDPFARKPVLRVPGLHMAWPAPMFSSDDRYLGYNLQGTRVKLWEVANAAPVFRTFHTGTVRINAQADISPQGSLLAWGDMNGTRVWNLTSNRELPPLPGQDIKSALFHPDGNSLITSGYSGLHRWPITMDQKGAETSPAIGPPEVLSKSPHGYAAINRDGRYLAADSGSGRVSVHDLKESARPTPLGSHPRFGFLAISPKGDYVATGAWHGAGVKVWDAKTGRLLRDLPIRTDRANVAFSSDGMKLITCTGEECQFWQVGSWEPGKQLYSNRSAHVPSRFAFTPQARAMAINHPRHLVRLIAPDTLEEFASLEAPIQESISSLSFDAEGGKLAVASDTWIQVWDLHLLRRQLKDLRLDWD